MSCSLYNHEWRAGYCLEVLAMLTELLYVSLLVRQPVAFCLGQNTASQQQEHRFLWNLRTYIHGSQRIKPIDLDDPLNSSSGTTTKLKSLFLVKCNSNCMMYCCEIWHTNLWCIDVICCLMTLVNLWLFLFWHQLVKCWLQWFASNTN